ncbi:MAG: HD domain-containing protein [Firmicutes bacterium]|nr:HD domain-containing protein [Bacillota bacterium]
MTNEGLTDINYQAYTYDFTVKNDSRDEVSDFSFKFTFGKDAFLLSAWNGALEIHQNVSSAEVTDTVADLREFVPEDHKLETVTVDGEYLIPMKAGDYFVYIPSSSMNAMEVPIEPSEATTPGIIMYVPVGDDIESSVLELEYTFHRTMAGEPLFWVSMAGLAAWLISLMIFLITSAQIRKYKERHERDNEIINESIETFTGFIDAKDPYTNGHSKRVAMYTRRIAEEFGYSGDELDRIYYVALLHDSGKIGVPDNILGKPGKLTDEEFEIIKSHTVLGGNILSHFKSLKGANEGALYHHERYDGKGYPEGKAGEEIPFIARMICVADSYDAMNTDRVYRKKLTTQQIISEIEKNKGKQFDPAVAEVMLALLHNDSLPKES